MKRPTVLFLAGLICCSCVQSQDKFMRDAAENSHGSGSQQFRLAYGINAFPSLSESNGNGIHASLPNMQATSTSTIGALGFSYLNDVVYKFAWGFDIIFQQANTSYVYGDNEQVSYQVKYVSIMPRMDYRYLNHEQFQIYSGLAAGINYGIATSNSAPKANKANIAFQATALGMRVGNYFAIFGEVGYGYRGIFNGGLSCRF